MPLLPNDDIADFTDAHPAWSWADTSISRTYEFANFNQAMGFVVRVGMEAEKADHHPDIDIRWNKVTLNLSTHSAGGITEKDLALADRADALA